jgi:hypothetical protein
MDTKGILVEIRLGFLKNRKEPRERHAVGSTGVRLSERGLTAARSMRRNRFLKTQTAACINASVIGRHQRRLGRWKNFANTVSRAR